MPRYPVAEHPLLSAAAAALAEPALDAHATLAERVLGFSNAELLEGDEATEAAGYVALQINLQLRMKDRGDVVAESKGSQSFTYAEVGGQRVPVDPIAAAGAGALLQRLPPMSVSESSTVVW